MEAHQAQNSLGASLPEVQCERFTELQSSELQATALRILDEYEARLREHEEKIRELRTRHIPELKSMYNSGASVNQLPIELLMHIFRAVGPRTSPADAIRLTHVCRSWRSLIHHTPVFWSDFLDSVDGILARTQADYSIVSAAFDRSAPAMQIGFSLNGAFLPLLSAIPAHVSRISKLWLDCTDRNSSAMHPFFGLHIPHLEDLTLWLWPWSHLPRDTQPDVHFPHLRRLQTNCVRFSLPWIRSTVRFIYLGGNRVGFENDDPGPCCRLPSLDPLFEALTKCPDIEELGLDGCLPDASSMSEQLPTLALPHLKSLELWGRTGVVRSVMDHVVLPESANINLSSDTPNHALSEMLPTTNRILGIPSINRLIVDIGHASNESLSYRYSAWGEANAEDEERLSLHSFMVLPPSSVNEFDLCRFFEGFVSIFPPSSITYLKLSCFDTPVDKNGGFAYIFNYYPHLTHLNLDLTSLEGALAALAQDGILVHLQRFEVEIDVIGGQYSSVEYETVVSVLETRASRGLRLQSFSLSVEVADEQDYLPLPMADHLIRRLASIISDLSIQPPHYPACSRS